MGCFLLSLWDACLGHGARGQALEATGGEWPFVCFVALLHKESIIKSNK